jgi:hypothetical protein
MQPPSLEELSVPGRDAIRDPMGNMTSDPTGLGGLYNLPAAALDYRDETARRAQAGEDVSERWKDDPGLNALAGLVIPGGLMKGAGVLTRAAAPYIAPALGDLMRDESGALRLPEGAAAPAPAIAPEPRSGLIKQSDFDELLPDERRRMGPYKEGAGTVPTVGGADWTDLDMTKPIGGMQASPEAHQASWDAAVAKIRDWSPEQAATLDKYLADHPEVGPNTWDFWNKAFSQPQKNRGGVRRERGAAADLALPRASLGAARGG